MPAWLDMRETWRMRERVGVASSSLPYWNAEGAFASTGLPTHLASELSASSLPLAKKLALISDGNSDVACSEHSSVIQDAKKPGRLQADRKGKAELLSQKKPLKAPLSRNSKHTPLKSGPAQRRKLQPKQGPVAAQASASQMASGIRRQLLELCRQAGVHPGQLQVPEPEPPEPPLAPLPCPPGGTSRPHKDLATQLRHATMARAQRERDIQRRSRAAQTTERTAALEICIKMNPEPTLVPKSVQLEGYHWETAARTKPPCQGSDTTEACPPGLFQQGVHVSNAVEDEIVVGGLHSGGEEAFDDFPEVNVCSSSHFDGRPPLAESFEMQREADSDSRGYGSLDQVSFSSGWNRWQPFPAPEQQSNCSMLIPSGRGGTSPFARVHGRRAANDESYDITVFQAMWNRTFGTCPTEAESEAEAESSEPRPSSSPRSPSPPARELHVAGPQLEPAESPPEMPAVDQLDQLDQGSGSARSQPRSPVSPTDSEDFLAARPPLAGDSHCDSSDGLRDISQELPPLPEYRPLPLLRDPATSGFSDECARQSRLAPKQLEEQFYNSLQILDSVQEHLSQVDLLSQQRVLRRQHNAEAERERQAGLEAQIAQQAQLESTIAWLETTRQAQQQLILQLQSVDEEARRSRQEFAADYEARELQRQEETEILERERLEREQSILERQREMLLLLGLTLDQAV